MVNKKYLYLYIILKSNIFLKTYKYLINILNYQTKLKNAKILEILK